MASGVAISALVLSILLLILFIIGAFFVFSNINQIKQDIDDLQSITLIIPTTATTLSSTSPSPLSIVDGDTVYLINGTQPSGFTIELGPAASSIGRPFYIINETGSPLVITAASGVTWGNNITTVNMPSAKSTAAFVFDDTNVVYYIMLGEGVMTNLIG
jgi:hypothetical protein